MSCMPSPSPQLHDACSCCHFHGRSHMMQISCLQQLEPIRWTASRAILCRASFDGRHPLRVLRGSSMRCSTSFCALPMVSLGKVEEEWFQGITQKLRWNSSPAEFVAKDPAQTKQG